jgi:hypothetical protein
MNKNKCEIMSERAVNAGRKCLAGGRKCRESLQEVL